MEQSKDGMEVTHSLASTSCPKSRRLRSGNSVGRLLKSTGREYLLLRRDRLHSPGRPSPSPLAALAAHPLPGGERVEDNICPQSISAVPIAYLSHGGSTKSLSAGSTRWTWEK